MTRVLVVAGLAALLAPAVAHAAGPPPVARPNPALVAERLDYVNPLRGSDGQPAELVPLQVSVVDAAVRDHAYLAYLRRDDLGGFRPAPVGEHALTSGGRDVVGAATGPSQIPHLATAANGAVNSFAAVPGEVTTAPPDQGQQPVPGLGIPVAPTPPTNNNTVPPPNQGFGGNPPPAPPPATTTAPGATGPATTTGPSPTTTTTPTTTRPPPTTTTTPTATTTPTTTAPATTTLPTTTAAGPPPGPPPGTTSCGTNGLTIFSNLSACRIEATNMAPGGSADEVVTVRNDSDQTFTLSLRAEGTTNQLWNDLRFGAWQAGTAAPAPLPPLLFWRGQDNDLGTLAPGQSVRYQLELYLPASASNADQGIRATIDLVWRART